MNNFKYLALIILLISCAEKNKNSEPGKIKLPGNDTIPVTRKNVNKKPVAAYVIQMGDPKLDRKFGVEVYETPETFKYLLMMYHDGTIQKDTLTIPNFGIWPTVKIRPGNEKLSCIIGFLDRKNEFLEYKLLSAKDDKLSLTILKRYGVATYYR
ncbi:MAG TPA: hypothetical protein VMY77_02730 [Chitinophagaceae bacterium]|nr:hypothetical protein [Chitinophagaceae bacterium]